MPPLDFSGSGTLADAPADERKSTAAPDFSKFGTLVPSDEKPERPGRLSRVGSAVGGKEAAPPAKTDGFSFQDAMSGIGRAGRSAISVLNAIGNAPYDALKALVEAQWEDISTGYANKPGYEYGSQLPYRKNLATGKIDWGHSPEAARAVIRGLGIDPLKFDINDPQQRSDLSAAAGALGGFSRAPGGLGLRDPGAQMPPLDVGGQPRLPGPPSPPGAPPEAYRGRIEPRFDEPPPQPAPSPPAPVSEPPGGPGVGFVPEAPPVAPPAGEVIPPPRPTTLPTTEQPPPAATAPAAGIEPAPPTVAPARASEATSAPLTGEVLTKADLWKMPREQLEAMLTEEGESTHQKLVQALGGEEQAKEFERLDRKRNSSNPQRSDEGSREFDEKFGNLTPDQERLVYGIGETDAQHDDIKTVLDAHNQRHDNVEDAAYEAASAIRAASASDILAVPKGGQSPAAQGAFVRLSNAYEDMLKAGMPPDQVGMAIVGALVERGGWKARDAAEVVGGFMDKLQATQAPQEPEQPAAPQLVAPEPVAGHGGPWSPVLDKDGASAKNRQGEALFENSNGVRATMENGVPYTESTTTHPEKGLLPRNPIDRRGQFLTAEETGLGAAPPKTRPGNAPEESANSPTVEKPAEKLTPKAPTKPTDTDKTKPVAKSEEPRTPATEKERLPSEPKPAPEKEAAKPEAPPESTPAEKPSVQERIASADRIPAKELTEFGDQNASPFVLPDGSIISTGGDHASVATDAEAHETGLVRINYGDTRAGNRVLGLSLPEEGTVLPEPQRRTLSRIARAKRGTEVVISQKGGPDRMVEPADLNQWLADHHAEKPAPTEHPGLVITSLETGKTTTIQPIGTVPPASPEAPETTPPEPMPEAGNRPETELPAPASQSLPEVTQSAANQTPPEPMAPLPPEPAVADAVSLAQGKGPVPVTAETTLEEPQQESQVAPLPEEEGADGLQGTIRPGDAGEGPEGLPEPDTDGQDGGAPSGEVGGGPRDAEPTAGAGAEGQTRRTNRGGSSGGGRSRVRDPDRLPDTREGSEPGDAGRPPQERAPDTIEGTNFIIEPGALGEDRGRALKARDNVVAIELAKRLTAGGRLATRAEQEVLVKYVGWGGLKNAFRDSTGQFGKGMEAVGARLEQLLTPEEYRTAERSTQYAHYTAEHVIRSMWDAVKGMGFEGGSVFEPGMGIGHFLGLMPPDLAANSTYRGIEMDHLTADIAKLLYPLSGIRQADFTRMALPENAFDLVIGNPPFSDAVISSDKKYAADRFMLHDYFFAKSLDAVRPGGLLAFVTSAGTMNKMGAEGREYLAERAEFLGGVRLPSSAFRQNAMTDVTTDVLFFQRRPEGKVSLSPGEAPEWTQVEPRTLPNAEGGTTEGNVNRYFSAHPEMVLGQEGFFDKLYKDRYAVHQTPGTDLPADLRAAIERLPRDVMRPAPTPEQKAEMDFSSNEKKDGSFYVKDGTLMQYSGGVGREVLAFGKGVKGGLTAADRDRVTKLIPVRDALREVFAADLARDEEAGQAARARLNETYDDFVKWFGPINKGTIEFRRPTIVQQEGARAEAHEEARFIGDPWVEGSFDSTEMYQAKATPGEIARAREAARQQALAAGQPFNEGSFDPADMPDTVVEKRPNIKPFMTDPESYRVRSIESYDDSTGGATKKPIFERSILTYEEEPKINSAHDGVLWSLNKLGRFDVEAIAEKMEKTPQEIVGELGDDVFRIPGTEDTYQTKDEYLSGDVVTKLEQAREAAKRDPDLERNVTALEAAAPRPLAPGRISMVLGMPWMPPEVVSEFVRDHLQLGEPRITYSPAIGTWSVTAKYLSGTPGYHTWGTSRRSAYELLSDALNRTPPRVYTEKTRDSPAQFDPVGTQAAQDKMTELANAFFDPETRSGWVMQDQTRANELADLYNAKLNREVLRQYDGSYLTTPGVSDAWSWRPHQTRVVSRIILEGNTYMAHAVGAGKTSAMIGAGMEMKRLGLVRKPMYVVPNHMLGQFTKEFYEQYPTARIAVADEERFHTHRRRQFVANVAQDDLDAVIITHSGFQKVPVSDEFQADLIQEQIDMLVEAMKELDPQSDRITVGRMQKQREKLEQRLSKAGGTEKDQTLTFEEMGVDFVFVDEAHLFRKLSFATKQGQMKGISPEGSNMSWDLFTKVRYLDSQRPGRSVVFASGTPITNTMGELYSLSRFMQPEALKARGLSHFDAWAQTFGTTKTTLEETAAGTYQPVTRFGKFVNMPELYKMVGGVMDIVTPSQLEQYVTRPKLKGGERQFHMAPRSEILDAYQATLGARMEAIKRRKGPPKPGDDILLSVINDGRHAAIDPRFVEQSQSDPTSKLNLLVGNVARIYHETGNVQFFDPGSGYEKPSFKGPATQMIFANLGVNGRGPMGFSGYRWIKEGLRRAGVPADEIAFIGDYGSTIARQKLFNDMNEGKVRVLIGSTQKMGTGVNAQRRLIAVHNQDPLWFPADDEQRNGRILRQGNHNPEIEIHDYTTKGTYDSAMWQMMAKKAGFIEQFFRGDPTLRDMEDVGEASMYEQASAMSTTDERILTLTQMKQDLDKARRRESAHGEEQWAFRTKHREHLSAAGYYDRSAVAYGEDIKQRVETTGKKFSMTVAGETYATRKDALEAFQATVDERRATMGAQATSVIGNIGGFKIRLRTGKTGKHTYYDLDLILTGDRIRSLSHNDTVASAETVIRDFELDRRNAILNAEKERSDAAAIEPHLGKSFEGGDEIRRLDEAARELEAVLRKEANAAERAKKGEGPEIEGEATEATD